MCLRFSLFFIHLAILHIFNGKNANNLSYRHDTSTNTYSFFHLNSILRPCILNTVIQMLRFTSAYRFSIC